VVDNIFNGDVPKELVVTIYYGVVNERNNEHYPRVKGLGFPFTGEKTQHIWKIDFNGMEHSVIQGLCELFNGKIEAGDFVAFRMDESEDTMVMAVSY
jgi:hypothetical protein